MCFDKEGIMTRVGFEACPKKCIFPFSVSLYVIIIYYNDEFLRFRLKIRTVCFVACSPNRSISLFILFLCDLFQSLRG